MTSNVFYDGLNEFSRKYFVADSKLSAVEISQFSVQRQQVEATVFENLLLFDRVSLKVFGENIPLAVLLNLFGERGLEELIEQDALEFILWTPFVAFMEDYNEGIDPLVSGTHNSKAHSDPEESIELGLNWMTNKPLRSKRRALVRKLRDLYRIPADDLPHNAVGITKSAYSSGKLKAYGFDPEKRDIRKLNQTEKQRLCTCAEDLLEYTYLLSNKMTSFSKREFFEFFAQSQNRLKVANAKSVAFCKLAELEEFPDLKTLYTQLEAPLQKMLKVRGKRSSQRFRSWLDNPTPPDERSASEITKEYIDAIANAKGFFQTTTGKLTKTAATSSIGAGIGAVIGGIPGVVMGASVGKILEPAADIALDLVDQFLIDGLTKGWTPRIFIDDLRDLRKI
jgi:hypothetical protein